MSFSFSCNSLQKTFMIGFFLSLLVLATIFSCRPSKYKYFSDIEKTHCDNSYCPGVKCVCILGKDNTFYLNETIGE